MNGYCYTEVFANPKNHVIFDSLLRNTTKANLIASNQLSNERAMQKIPGSAKSPLSSPINDRDMNEALTNSHSEKQIARWLIKKSEYNEGTI